jgi:pimeloyl-ACP methyl ester carboxylesterase
LRASHEMISQLCIQDRLIFTQLRERDGRSAMPYLSLHGTDLYYETNGRGEPLVLLHNGLGSTKSFSKQMPEFSKSFRVVTYDRRGYGRSAHATSLKKGWLEESVDELSCFLDEIKVDRAHLCGICVGGAIALLLAVKNPSRVDRITVAGTCCFGETETSRKALKLYPHPDDLPPDWLRELTEHHGETYGKDLYRVFYQAIREENGYPFKEYDLRPILPQVKSPVLVIYGDKDNLFSLEQAFTMHKHLRKARLRIISSCGHLPNEEKPEEFNREAMRFFRSPPD